jgi:hypothetical protein
MECLQISERGLILVLTGARPAERWRRYTTLYLYLAVMCQDLTIDGRRSSLQKAKCGRHARGNAVRRDRDAPQQAVEDE